MRVLSKKIYSIVNFVLPLSFGMNKEILTSKKHNISLTSLFHIDELSECFFILFLFSIRWLTFYCQSFFCLLIKVLELQLLSISYYSIFSKIKVKHAINIFVKYPKCALVYF